MPKKDVGSIKKVVNKGNKGALDTQGTTYRGKYVSSGMTSAMHGKAKGGGATKRATDMKGF